MNVQEGLRAVEQAEQHRHFFGIEETVAEDARSTQSALSSLRGSHSDGGYHGSGKSVCDDEKIEGLRACVRAIDLEKTQSADGIEQTKNDPLANLDGEVAALLEQIDAIEAL